MRKEAFSTDFYYHIFTKSIEGYKVFNYKDEYCRMQDLLRYYQLDDLPCAFSQFLRLSSTMKSGKEDQLRNLCQIKRKRVEILSYCLMPTHLHLVAQQCCENGLLGFMKDLLNSYSRYFNNKHKRKGPLWVGRFKSVLVKNDEQLLHLTRYVHLNPTTAHLVDRPEEWTYSSYREYIGRIEVSLRISNFSPILDVPRIDYRQFVESRIDVQRQLGILKYLLLD